MIYRTEHPKPQFEREAWENLNGEWQFEIDRGNSGAARGLFADTVTLSGKINVPFCPQSSLSGVADRDFMNSVWYRRTFEITDEQLKGIVRLHFGAVDYKATVYVNGRPAQGRICILFHRHHGVREGRNQHPHRPCRGR